MAKEPIERVRFPGSDTPLQPTREEKLNAQADDEQENEDDEEDGEAPAPDYKREEIGARVGEEIESRQDAAKLAESLDEEETVALIFSKPVKMQDRGLMHHWGPGVHLVPKSVAFDAKGKLHWWLRSCKVRRAADPRKPASK